MAARDDCLPRVVFLLPFLRRTSSIYDFILIVVDICSFSRNDTFFCGIPLLAQPETYFLIKKNRFSLHPPDASNSFSKKPNPHRKEIFTFVRIK